MYPEEAVQAALDAQVKISMPVHWAGFPLALHTWQDPIQRFTKEAADKNVDVSTPQLGEIFTASQQLKHEWWKELK